MTLQNVVTLGLSLLLAYLHFGMSGQAVAYVIASAITFGIFYFISRRELSGYISRPGEVHGFSLSLQNRDSPTS